MKQNNYNFIAPFYDKLVQLIFGKAVFQSQIKYLNQLPQKGKIIFIGGGSGKVLSVLLQKRPHLKIIYLERSKKMISLSARKIKNHKNVIFSQKELSQYSDNAEFDAVLTFFFFDIFKDHERQELFDQLDRLLKTKGLWLIADFLPPKNFQHIIISKCMFWFLKLTTNITAKAIDNYQSLFPPDKYHLMQERHFYKKFIFSSFYTKKTFC